MGGAPAGSPIAAFKGKFGATLHLTHELRAEHLLVHTAREYSEKLVKKVGGFPE